MKKVFGKIIFFFILMCPFIVSAYGIENFYINKNLKEEDVVTIYDAIQKDYFKKGRYFFSPMGMAIFDIAIATYYYNKAKKENIGKEI